MPTAQQRKVLFPSTVVTPQIYLYDQPSKSDLSHSLQCLKEPAQKGLEFRQHRMLQIMTSSFTVLYTKRHMSDSSFLPPYRTQGG